MYRLRGVREVSTRVVQACQRVYGAHSTTRISIATHATVGAYGILGVFPVGDEVDDVSARDRDILSVRGQPSTCPLVPCDMMYPMVGDGLTPNQLGRGIEGVAR